MADQQPTAIDIIKDLPQSCWRQCGLCVPVNTLELPTILQHDATSNIILIATQTCSLIGKGADPSFEVLSVQLVDDFNPASDEAKGRTTRFLQLPLAGETETRGIRIDISRRAILPISALSEIQSTNASISEKSLKAFQGWIARYYSRIALPDELDRRLEKRKFHKKVKNVFEHTLLDSLTPYKIHSDIDKIYVEWTPDIEISTNENYHVRFLIICRRPQTLEYLLEKLVGLATGVKGAPLLNGLIMDDPEVKLDDEVLVSDISGMTRLTSYDQYSALAEVAKTMTSE